jgi:hypothetical protein
LKELSRKSRVGGGRLVGVGTGRGGSSDGWPAVLSVGEGLADGVGVGVGVGEAVRVTDGPSVGTAVGGPGVETSGVELPAMDPPGRAVVVGEAPLADDVVVPTTPSVVTAPLCSALTA